MAAPIKGIARSADDVLEVRIAESADGCVANVKLSDAITDKARDRRRSILKLTARGARTHQEIVPIARGHESELAAALTKKERQSLDSLLAKLQQRASEIAAQGEPEALA